MSISKKQLTANRRNAKKSTESTILMKKHKIGKANPFCYNFMKGIRL